jgi:hypothetical protein
VVVPVGQQAVADMADPAVAVALALYRQ